LLKMNNGGKMPFIEDYIKEPLKYAFSDLKKGVVGGVLVSLFPVALSTLMLLLTPYLDKMKMGFYSMPHLTPLIIIVGVLAFIGFLISFLVYGYYVKVMKSTLEGNNQLPEWDGFGEMFIKGILWCFGGLLVSIIFLIIPLLVMGIGVVYLPKSPDVGIILFGLGILSMILFLIPLAFYIPLATINFAKKGFFGFFEFVEIFKKFSLEYITLFIAVMVVVFIVATIVQLPFIIVKVLLVFANPKLPYIVDVVSAFVNSFVGFFLGVFQYRTFAKYYKKKELE